jgi:hypothetical protein
VKAKAKAKVQGEVPRPLHGCRSRHVPRVPSPLGMCVQNCRAHQQEIFTKLVTIVTQLLEHKEFLLALWANLPYARPFACPTHNAHIFSCSVALFVCT